MLEALNPKKQLKRLFKKQLPKLKKDLFAIIDDLILQVADQNEANPYELILVLSKDKNKAIARVFTQDNVLMAQTDAGEIMRNLLLQQLTVLPSFLKDYIFEQLAGEDVAQIMVDALEYSTLLIHYTDNEKLVFVEIRQGEQNILDLDDFFNNLEF